MRFLIRMLAMASMAVAACLMVAPLQAQLPAKPQQFLYVLRVTPAFHDAKLWTARENDAVSRHFRRLSQATEAGKVIFAGRTNEPLGTTFGLVVFEAENEAEARRFMETDPAVEAGVMSATLHPYALALQRKPAEAASR